MRSDRQVMLFYQREPAILDLQHGWKTYGISVNHRGTTHQWRLQIFHCQPAVTHFFSVGGEIFTSNPLLDDAILGGEQGIVQKRGAIARLLIATFLELGGPFENGRCWIL